VWEQSGVGDTEIWANRYVPGSGWGTAQAIQLATNSRDAQHPRVAIDAAGNAMAVWQQSDGKQESIWANRYVAGTGWQGAELIEGDDLSRASQPEVSMSANGNAVAVWVNSRDKNGDIAANHFSAGSWGVVQQVAFITSADFAGIRAPQVALNARGIAVAVWVQPDGKRTRIAANVFAPGTGWGTTPELIDANTESADSPQIALDESSNAVAVWLAGNGLRSDIMANRFTPGSRWGTAELIEGEDGGFATQPQLAMTASGDAVAVWRHTSLFVGGTSSIRANRFTASAGWGVDELIETDDAGAAASPQVAINASGQAVAVWHQNNSIRNNIVSNRFNGTSWGAAELIETLNAGDAVFAQVGMDANGNAVAVWTQSDGAENSIMANVFK
jgi:hypothetical protein